MASAIDDAAASTTTVFSSSKTETQYLNAASNLADLASAATARVNLGVDHSPYYLDEVSGTYPNRPARTGPVVWRGPDAPGSSGGTTAGGTPNAVPNLDEWHRKALLGFGGPAFILGTTMPTAANTGFAASGLTRGDLTDFYGDKEVTSNGTIIEGLRIHGAVHVAANNCIVRNCEILGRAGAAYSSNLRGLITQTSGTGNQYYNNHLTQWDPATNTDNSMFWREGFYLGGGTATVSRNDIQDVNHLIYVTNGTFTIQGNYTHDFSFRNDDTDHASDSRYPNWSHNDGLHIAGGVNHLDEGNNYVILPSANTGANLVMNPDPAATQIWPNSHGHLLRQFNNAVTGLISRNNWMSYGALGYLFTTSTYTGGDATLTGNRINPNQCIEFGGYTQLSVNPTPDWGTISFDDTNVYSDDTTDASIRGLPLNGHPTGNPFTYGGTIKNWQAT